MRKLILLLSITLTTTLFAQKVEVDGDKLLVDGVPCALLEKTSSMAMDVMVKSLDGTELFFVQYNSLENAAGGTNYGEVTFFNDKQKCEVSGFAGTKKWVGKWIVQNGLIKDGALNQEAENKVVLINGMKYTEERKNRSGTVIINNN